MFVGIPWIWYFKMLTEVEDTTGHNICKINVLIYDFHHDTPVSLSKKHSSGNIYWLVTKGLSWHDI